MESAAVVRSLAKRQRIPPPSFGCRLNKLNFTLDAHKENSCDCNSFCATWLVWLRPTGWMNWEHLRRLIRAVVCIWCRLDLIFFFFYTYSEMRITGVHSGSTEARLIFHHVPHQVQASEFAVVQSEFTNFTAIILSWGGWMPKTSNVRSLY